MNRVQFINSDYQALFQQQLYDYQQDRQLARTVSYLQMIAAVLAIIGILYGIAKSK